MPTGRPPHSTNDSYALSAYPANRSDIDDTTTLHSDIPNNSSRTNLVGPYGMAYPGPTSDDEHNVQTPRAKTTFKQSTEKRPQSTRHGSWDMLGGHQFNEGFEFNTSTAKEEHLRFAQGDFAVTPMSKFYAYLLNLSIVTRWILYIFPVLGLLWIPGILGLTVAKDARLATVPLLYWSIWFTVVWGGWWAAFAVAKMLPSLFRATIGIVLLSSRKYIDFLGVCQRYIAFFGWSLSVWIAFTRMLEQFADNKNPLDSALTTIAAICEALFISATILAIEKLLIQYIALAFHQTSYADRLAEQKMNVKFLVVLYRNSSNIPGRLDTMNDDQSTFGQRMNPKKVLKDFLHGMRSVAETSATALGNIATEIAGSSVLQPNSPEGRVQVALTSANKSRLLARRLYYSFRSEGSKIVTLNDIARFFPDFETAQLAFQMFDKDGNGDVSRDEMEMACMEVHRERLSLAASMKNLDSAVGRLDAILVYIWFLVALLILIACLDVGLYTTLSAFGGSLLALSWLFGGTATEILASIIFLFIKHPYDCGDRVDIDNYQFTVKEIQLLSTIFMTTSGKSVQCSHAVLNAKYIENVRRSGQMAETFTFDVDFGTTFEQLEKLRAKMLAFVTSERRDYLPQFDVVVQDIPAQGKMTLTVQIKYKSNWQQVALHAQRHNKWVCALKEAMGDCKIFGPGGAGNPSPAPAPPNHVTLVPWEEVKAEAAAAKPASPAPAYREPLMPRSDWNLSDRNAVLRDDERDVFGVSDELTSTTMRSRGIHTPNSTRPNTRSNTPDLGSSGGSGPYGYGRSTAVPPVPAMPQIPPGTSRRMASAEGEEFEMQGGPTTVRTQSAPQI